MRQSLLKKRRSSASLRQVCVCVSTHVRAHTHTHTHTHTASNPMDRRVPNQDRDSLMDPDPLKDPLMASRLTPETCRRIARTWMKTKRSVNSRESPYPPLPTHTICALLGVPPLLPLLLLLLRTSSEGGGGGLRRRLNTAPALCMQHARVPPTCMHACMHTYIHACIHAYIYTDKSRRCLSHTHKHTHTQSEAEGGHGHNKDEDRMCSLTVECVLLL